MRGGRIVDAGRRAIPKAILVGLSRDRVAIRRREVVASHVRLIAKDVLEPPYPPGGLQKRYLRRLRERFCEPASVPPAASSTSLRSRSSCCDGHGIISPRFQAGGSG